MLNARTIFVSDAFKQTNKMKMKKEWKKNKLSIPFVQKFGNYLISHSNSGVQEYYFLVNIDTGNRRASRSHSPNLQQYIRTPNFFCKTNDN